jgi:hypothetical protein
VRVEKRPRLQLMAAAFMTRRVATTEPPQRPRTGLHSGQLMSDGPLAPAPGERRGIENSQRCAEGF